MTANDVRLGTGGDMDDAASVYERANLARRQGNWPSRPARLAQVTANLHAAAHRAERQRLWGRLRLQPERSLVEPVQRQARRRREA